MRRSEGQHESGAFLLGRISGKRRQALQLVFYDELDPEAYDSGVCILTGKSFSKLWKVCRAKAMTVVADIHMHLGSAFQSEADRTNPTIAEAGHIALIAPNLCRGNVGPNNLCVYEYLGGYQWIDHSQRARQFFYVGFCG